MGVLARRKYSVVMAGGRIPAEVSTLWMNREAKRLLFIGRVMERRELPRERTLRSAEPLPGCCVHSSQPVQVRTNPRLEPHKGSEETLLRAPSLE